MWPYDLFCHIQINYLHFALYLINSDKLNNSKSFELGESNINIDLSKDAILVCAWNKERFVNALLNTLLYLCIYFEHL